MVKKVLFTLVTVGTLAGGCFIYIKYILKNKEKYTDRIMKLYDDREESGNDTNN